MARVNLITISNILGVEGGMTAFLNADALAEFSGVNGR